MGSTPMRWYGDQASSLWDGALSAPPSTGSPKKNLASTTRRAPCSKRRSCPSTWPTPCSSLSGRNFRTRPGSSSPWTPGWQPPSCDDFCRAGPTLPAPRRRSGAVMKAPHVHAAIDLGASSARLFAGRVEGRRLVTSEVTRLANGPIRLPDGWHWDVLRIHQGILLGLAELSRQVAGEPIWAGIDGWGVDYGLVDPAGHLLGLPFCYRDQRTAGGVGLANQVVGRGRIYEATGIQEMEINTLFQLLSEKESAAYT